MSGTLDGMLGLRILGYFFLIVGLFIVGVWLTFGPGIAQPLEIVIRPGASLVQFFNPELGSEPSADFLFCFLVSVPIWLALLVTVDLAVSAWLRRRTAV